MPIVKWMVLSVGAVSLWVVSGGLAARGNPGPNSARRVLVTGWEWVVNGQNWQPLALSYSSEK